MQFGRFHSQTVVIFKGNINAKQGQTTAAVNQKLINPT